MMSKLNENARDKKRNRSEFNGQVKPDFNDVGSDEDYQPDKATKLRKIGDVRSESKLSKQNRRETKIHDI